MSTFEYWHELNFQSHRKQYFYRSASFINWRVSKIWVADLDYLGILYSKQKTKHGFLDVCSFLEKVVVSWIKLCLCVVFSHNIRIDSSSYFRPGSQCQHSLPRLLSSSYEKGVYSVKCYTQPLYGLCKGSSSCSSFSLVAVLLHP